MELKPLLNRNNFRGPEGPLSHGGAGCPAFFRNRLEELSVCATKSIL